MKFAVISAGEGSRLSQEGAPLPKPLTLLNGVPMIDRLLHLFMRCGATQIVVIINNESEMVKQHLDKLKENLPLQVVVKTTPSSMHSFYELAPYLDGDRFCLTTVDTIFREEEFAAFIRAFKESEKDGFMAVTDYVDDEKPLYIGTDSQLRITGFYDAPIEGGRYISGGVYCLRQNALEVLQKCIQKGMSRMRNFQRELVTNGLELQAYPFGKILDVDHVEDIAKAEVFLAGSEQ